MNSCKLKIKKYIYYSIKNEILRDKNSKRAARHVH